VRFRDGGQGGEQAMITTSFSPSLRMDRSLNRRLGETGNSYFAHFFLSGQNEPEERPRKKMAVRSNVFFLAMPCAGRACHHTTLGGDVRREAIYHLSRTGDRTGENHGTGGYVQKQCMMEISNMGFGYAFGDHRLFEPGAPKGCGKAQKGPPYTWDRCPCYFQKQNL
jgi:hypothetical protein